MCAQLPMDIFCSINCTFSNSNKAQCMSAVSSVCISTSLFFLVLQRTFCRCTIFKAANPYAAILHSLLRLYKKIRASIWSTRTFSGAGNCSCSKAAYTCKRGITKSTLFLSHTRKSTQQRSGNLSWQFYCLKIDNYNTIAVLQSNIISVTRNVLKGYKDALHYWQIKEESF